MITAEIKINGCLIGHIYLVNKEQETSNIYRYEGRFTEIESGKNVYINVRHKRSDGAIKLISIATKEILKQVSKEDK